MILEPSTTNSGLNYKHADKMTVEKFAAKKNLSPSCFTVFFRRGAGLSLRDNIIYLKL